VGSQQLPALHVSPAQQLWPVAPQLGVHPAVLVHRLVDGSQAPLVHTSPGQQGLPGDPHAVQTAPVLSQTCVATALQSFFPEPSTQQG
jgi:hypothetical protein